MVAEQTVQVLEPVEIEPAYRDVLALVSERMNSKAWHDIDAMEEIIAGLEPSEMPLTHLFVPHMYCRGILMRKNALVTTRIHLTEHFFTLAAGVVAVWDDDRGWVVLHAPCTGITKPGTRRILFILEDAVWNTYHVTDLTDPDEIVRKLTYSEGKWADLRMAAKNFTIKELAPVKETPQIEETP